MHYVVYYCEHLRDDHNEGAKVFPTLAAALAFLTKARNEWFAADNHEFRLFELGKELPLKQCEVQTPTTKVETKFEFSVGETAPAPRRKGSVTDKRSPA
jgi:hypothetical protein